MEEERRAGEPATARCRYCGIDANEQEAEDLRARGATYQVIVACASCGSAFAALARN